MGSLIGGIAGIFGGKSKTDTVKQGIDTSRGDIQKGIDELTQYHNTAQGYFDPYSEQGLSALKALSSDAALQQRNTDAANALAALKSSYDSAYAQREAAPANFNYQADPGYQFASDLAQRALNQQLAARGKYFSGRAVAEGTNNLQGNLASNMYNTLYGRYMDNANTLANMATQNAGNYYSANNSNINDAYGLGQNRLGTLLNYGFNAAGQQANNAMNTGRSILGARTGQANIAATGYNNLADARQAQWQNWGNLGKEVVDTAANAYLAFGKGGGGLSPLMGG